MIKFTTVEMYSSDCATSAAIMAAAFGYPSTAYGDSYIDVHAGDEFTVAFETVSAAPPIPSLPVFEVEDLDTARTAITAAGGVVTVEPFDFPGGRRFQFREPGGNELAVWVRVDAIHE